MEAIKNRRQMGAGSGKNTLLPHVMTDALFFSSCGSGSKGKWYVEQNLIIKHEKTSQQIIESKSNMKPTTNDVLKGRGLPIQNRPGNRYFRKIVANREAQYALMKRTCDKEAVAMQVLNDVQNQTPPGRFLDQRVDGSYFLLDREATLRKIKQALRDINTDKKSKPSEPKPSKSEQKESKTSDKEKPQAKVTKGSKYHT